MRSKKITNIFTGILLSVCMLATFIPVNLVFADETIDYTAPTITRFIRRILSLCILIFLFP